MALPKRKTLRIPYFDYSQNGAYFITICTRNKEKNLCHIRPSALASEAPAVEMTPIGTIVKDAIQKIHGIEKYVIMPNHIHLILLNQDGVEISSKIKVFKNIVARKSGKKLWQSSFYDHVIRDEHDYKTKWKYIDDNPAKWASDEYYTTT